MGAARAGLVLLVLLALLILADWGIHQAGGGSGAGGDANLVYCLAPQNQSGLVAAAVILGLVGNGSTPAEMFAHGKKVAVTRWRTADEADFTRACNAYATANAPAADAGQAPPGAGSGPEQLLDVLLPVIVGALLTMSFEYFKQAGDQRIALAEELRLSGREFEISVNNYLADSAKALAHGRPSSGDLDAKRRSLGADLRNISLRHPGSKRVQDLRDLLTGDDLGPALSEGGIVAKTQQIKGTLESFNNCLDRVASRLERAVWLPVRL